MRGRTSPTNAHPFFTGKKRKKAQESIKEKGASSSPQGKMLSPVSSKGEKSRGKSLKEYLRQGGERRKDGGRSSYRHSVRGRKRRVITIDLGWILGRKA